MSFMRARLQRLVPLLAGLGCSSSTGQTSPMPSPVTVTSTTNGASAATTSAGSGGMTGAGGSGTTATGGMGGNTVVGPPPSCDAGTNPPPARTPGVWTAVNPQGQVFGGDPGNGSFIQGVAIDPCSPSTVYACI